MSLLKQQLDSNLKASTYFWVVVCVGVLFVLLSAFYLA